MTTDTVKNAKMKMTTKSVVNFVFFETLSPLKNPPPVAIPRQ